MTVAADFPDAPEALLWFWGNVLLVGLAIAAQVHRILALPPATLHAGYRDPKHRRRLWRQVASVPLVAALCMVLALVHPRLSMWGWLPIFVGAVMAARRGSDDDHSLGATEASE